MTWLAIEAAMEPIVQTKEGAVQVASAFYDVVWVPVDSDYRRYGDAHGKHGCFSLSWRDAGEMVSRLRARGENYMDWCYDSQSAVVSDRVREVMAALGLRPVS